MVRVDLESLAGTPELEPALLVFGLQVDDVLDLRARAAADEEM